MWVARLYISPRTRQKIIQLHGITDQEVRDAVECVRGLYGTWDDDPERGLRAIIRTSIRGRRVLVVGDVYNLGSVYFDQKP